MVWVTTKEHFGKPVFHIFVMSHRNRFMIKTHDVSQKLENVEGRYKTTSILQQFMLLGDCREAISL